MLKASLVLIQKELSEEILMLSTYLNLGIHNIIHGLLELTEFVGVPPK